MLWSIPDAFVFFGQKALWIVVLFVGLLAVSDRQKLMGRVKVGVVTLLACNVLFLTFTLVKTTLPRAVHFWADPMLADIDRVLGFGQAPWRITHAVADWIPVGLGESIYMGLWVVPAMYMPMVLVLFDDSEERKARFLRLYVMIWVVLGSVMALALMSAGPVYYDRLHDSERFTALHRAMSRNGIADSPVGLVQEHLWTVYNRRGQSAGSGISAFPSIHIAMVMLWALYLGERWRWTWPLGTALVVIFLVLSVHFGWHYAVDGYASILIVG